MMKSYFKWKTENKLLFIITIFTAFLTSCHPGYILPSKVNTISKSSMIHLSNTGHLVIYPFETSELSAKLSLKVAQLFNEEIHKYNFFKKVTLIEDTTLLADMNNSALKIQKALYVAKKQNADAILLGAIDEYSDAVSTDTKVSINIMIISVKTGKKLWWGGKTVIGKPGNTFFLIGNRLSPDPPSAQQLLANATKKIIANVFSSN